MQPFAVFNDPFFQSFERDHHLISSRPQFDLIETKENFTLKANVPGFTKDQISLSFEGANLIVKGKL